MTSLVRVPVAYCGVCAEAVVPRVDGRCPWCDNPTSASTVTKVASVLAPALDQDVCHKCRATVAIAERGDAGVRDHQGVWCAVCYAKAHKGWPMGPWTRRELLALYILYVKRGITIAELVGQLWERKGYRNCSGAVSVVQQAWRRNGWPTRRRGESKRLRTKRTGPRLASHRKLSEREARALHPLHWEQWQSVNSIAKEHHERLGLSASALCSQLCYTWQLLGLPRHDRIEMCVRASTRHGLARRQRPKGGGKNGNGAKSPGYKRWLLNQRAGGETRNPICTATTAKGKPCVRRALDGKDVCFSHDPDLRERHRQHLAAMRARSPIHDPDRLEPADDLAELLRIYHDAGGSWRALARSTALPESWLSHVAHGKQANVDRGRAQRIREALIPEAVAA